MNGSTGSRSRPRSGSALLLSLTAAGAAFLALQGCGAGEASHSPGAKAPASSELAHDPDTEPATIEEAEKRIATAKAELAYAGAGGTITADSSGADSAQAQPTQPSQPSAAPRPYPAPEGRPRISEAPPARTAPAADRCVSPCRALASMRRAVTALCRMTGEEDARCSDGKRTLADSLGRVAPCSC